MEQGIGDSMIYTDRKGRMFTGLIVNTLPAVLMDVVTGERYEARKFYLWNEQQRRGVWTCAMKPSQEGVSS